MPNIDEILSGARDAVTVKRVYGDPVEIGDVVVIPAAAVRGGGGGGGDSDGDGGGGFGLAARPVGAYVVRDGTAYWQPAGDPVRTALGWQVIIGLGILAAWSLARR